MGNYGRPAQTYNVSSIKYIQAKTWEKVLCEAKVPFSFSSVRDERKHQTKNRRTSAGDCIVKDDTSYKIPANRATVCQQKRRSKQSTEL